MGVREVINKKPWLGWTLAGVLFAVMVYMFVRGGRNTDPYSPERMTEMVTIRFADTGDEMTIPRGRMDKMLRERGSSLDPNEGIINPKTGKPTGFLFNKKEWDEWVKRINDEKAAAKTNSGKTVAPVPRETRQLSDEELQKLKEQAEKTAPAAPAAPQAPAPK
ncbi:MAG: hypothetical protein GC200_00535 [Tepidisphaera sp.]|nr:hypothetical protein [Tepidisphaera sp.]